MRSGVNDMCLKKVKISTISISRGDYFGATFKDCPFSSWCSSIGNGSLLSVYSNHRNKQITVRRLNSDLVYTLWTQFPY